MADEAFALSPISARPALPGEADYDAIREAFMETSRGRWFLGEYAKRNRNADTTMVLDAVARIEETLAAQKKSVRDPLLDEALAAFRNALAEARNAAGAALGQLALEQNLAPVRKGARVIREIAWRLREIGADGRICDLIDQQVAAIEGAAARLAPNDLAGVLNGVFDAVESRIAAFNAAGAAASPPAAADMPAAQVSGAVPAVATMVGEIIDETEALAIEPATAEEPAVIAEVVSEPVDAFNADDEAVLDRIAMEMAAPDTDVSYEPKSAQGFDSEEFGDIEVTFETRTEAAIDEPVATTVPPAVTPIPSEPVREPEPAPEAEPSLGSSLLANGIVTRPRTSRPDPFAPIRRMSQTEKIAFFS